MPCAVWLYFSSIKEGNLPTLNKMVMRYFSTNAFFVFASMFSFISPSFSQNVGIGTVVPKSKLDVSGGLSVGSYAGNTAAPANGIIISGNVGIGTSAPLYRLHVIHSSNTDGLILQNTGGGAGATTNIFFSTYADAVVGTSRPGARISAIDDGIFSAHMTFATKVPGADANALTERMRIESAGDLRMENGSSIHMPNNIAYVVDRTQRTNGTKIQAAVSNYTGNLPVETGDIVVINVSFKFAWNGGSGTDQPIFGIIMTGCASATMKDTYQDGDADDITRSQLQSLFADTNTNADDGCFTADVVLTARKY
jgi:hypothetical protein